MTNLNVAKRRYNNVNMTIEVANLKKMCQNDV